MDLSTTEIRRRIYSVRGYQVVLDSDLAEFYESETRLLNRAVKRNAERFPSDFAFRLTEEEARELKALDSFKNSKHGGGRYIPVAFTEHGVAMLSTVLKSKRAIHINIEIMRTFAGARTPVSDGRRTTEMKQMEKRLEQKFNQAQDEQFKLLLQGVQQILAKVEDKPAESSQTGAPSEGQASEQTAEFSEAADQAKLNQMQASIHGQELSVRIDTIRRAVAEYFGLKLAELNKASRSPRILIPRQIAIYLVRKNTGCSYREIGERFGQKDHSTVMHTFRKVCEAIELDSTVKETVSQIESIFAH